MKKVNKNPQIPELLKEYVRQYPFNEWESFQAQKDEYKELKKQLRKDQRNLCCYCENDLYVHPKSCGLEDFRVEHFYPKSPHSPPPNYGLAWNNMLGCCTGGASRYVADPNIASEDAPKRFTAPDLSCDAPKSNKNLTGIILDPQRDIPAFPPLFCYDTVTGKMAVDSKQCPTHLRQKAQKSIEELCLSPIPTKKNANPRLIKFRKALFIELEREMMVLQENGLNFEDALEMLAAISFSDDCTKPWPAFFSAIRFFLGEAAERRLKKIHYNG